MAKAPFLPHLTLRHLADKFEQGSSDERWLAEAIREILEGVDPAKALDLRRRAGAPHKVGRDLGIAFKVAERMRRDTRRRGARTRAIVAIADTDKMDERTVELAYDKYKSVVPHLRAIDAGLAAASSRLQWRKK